MHRTASLIVLALVLLLSSSAASDPRKHIPPRDYVNRDYYAAELVWPESDQQDPTVRARMYADAMGLRFEEQVGSLAGHFLFSAAKQEGADEQLARKIRARGTDLADLRYFEKMKLKRLYKRTLPGIESELDIRDPLFSKQWHLLNRVQVGHDINVTGVWLQNITGTGVVTAIVDDGLEFDSDDLHDNFFAKGSYDFNDPGPLPRPRLADDHHGTRCAGEIAAVKNDVCGIGAAYTSKVAGIRILSKEITDVDEALALNYGMQDNHIYSCSWGPPDDGKAMDAPGILIKRAFVNGVENGRNGLGSIFVFASGNGAKNGDNCNFDGYTNSIYSITVGAIDRMGLHPYYAEDCSAQLVVTYSSGSNDYIHTTDVGKRSCADNHGGTSAAAPLAAGIFALVLGVRPDLTWRDLQYLVVATAVTVDNPDADYQDTMHGRKFSHRYGYGKLDTYAIVEKAKTWKKVNPQAWYTSRVAPVHKAIPHGEQGFASYITVDEADLKAANLKRLEHVQVTVNIHHQRRGDVSVKLLSPTGVVSILATNRMYDESKEGMINWTFMSVAHWGEPGVGTWTLTVYDTDRPELSGTFEDWQLRLWGESVDASLAKPYPLPDDGSHSTAPTSTATSTPTPSPVPTSTAIATTSSSPLASSSPTSAAPTATSSDTSDTVHDSPFSFLPTFGVSAHKVVWIYGAGLLIIVFIVLLLVYVCVQRRKSTRSAGPDADGYEFQVLRNTVDLERSGAARGPRRKTRDLYDAFEDIDDEDPFAVEELLSEAEANDEGDDDEHHTTAAGSASADAETEEDRQRLLTKS